MSRLLTTLAILSAAPVALQAQQGGIADGKTTFETVCSTCHSVEPPAKLAPPMLHVSRHYRSAFASEEEAVAAMVRFILKPDTATATMPAHAIERFGLMPALPLSEAQLRGVARYVWELSAPSARE
jgi:cytochrome c